MIVNATEFKTRAGKYLEIVDKEEVEITRNGRETAKLVPITKQGTPNADFLYGLLADCENKDMTKKQVRDERVNKKYGLIQMLYLMFYLNENLLLKMHILYLKWQMKRL